MKFHPITIAVRKRLEEAANPDFALPMQAYMKSRMPYRGVKADAQRRLWKPLFKEMVLKDFDEFEQVVRELWDADYREERYAAIGLCEYHRKYQIPEALPLYRFMIETGAWWDLVDGVASHLVGRLLKAYPETVKPLMWEWIDESDIWVRRSAILAQLSFKRETDEAMLFEFCRRRLDEKEFWMRKAIGWALREYSKTEPDAVRKFINANGASMSGLTLREASKYV